MALKSVIKFSLIFVFFTIQTSFAQTEYKDIYHIKFTEMDSFELQKYSRHYDDKKLKFFFRNKHSLKSPLFIFNRQDKRTEMDSVKMGDITFSHPWEAYWAYHKAEEKPILFLYEFDNKDNCYYKYPVTIEFPPPPPYPGPVD